ncbi:MAG: hypothetical protein ABJB55_01095 [Actinomycetota bacterium]
MAVGTEDADPDGDADRDGDRGEVVAEVCVAGDRLALGVALALVDVADAEGVLDADADSSPPPSKNNKRSPATAGVDEGPSARGADQAGVPDARLTAEISSRPTTIASDDVSTGAGRPLTWVVSPMSAGAFHETRYGSAGASSAAPVRAALPWN